MRVGTPVLLALVLAAASAAAETAPGAPALDDLLQRVLAAQHGVTSISGRFTQRTVRSDDPEGGGTTYEARFELQAPDKYNIVYTKPGDDEYRLRYCSDGVRRAQQEQMMSGQTPDVSIQPVAKDGGAGDVMARITALFRLDPAAITRDFTISPQARGDAFTVLLVPRSPGLAEHIQRIEVDLDPSLRTQALRIDDPQGNRILVTISEAIYNPVLPPETFTVPTP